MSAACRCALPSHEDPRCVQGQAAAAQGQLYAGLYGSRSGSPPIRRARGSGPLQQVRLLTPDFDDEDSTARRFAQLEID